MRSARCRALIVVVRERGRGMGEGDLGESLLDHGEVAAIRFEEPFLLILA